MFERPITGKEIAKITEDIIIEKEAENVLKEGGGIKIADSPKPTSKITVKDLERVSNIHTFLCSNSSEHVSPDFIYLFKLANQLLDEVNEFGKYQAVLIKKVDDLTLEYLKAGIRHTNYMNDLRRCR